MSEQSSQTRICSVLGFVIPTTALSDLFLSSDDETVTILANDIGDRCIKDSDDAEAQGDLCDALFHGESIGGVPTIARDIGKGSRESRIAVAERPAPAPTRLRPKAASLQPNSRMAGHLWLAACFFVAVFFGWRAVNRASMPPKSPDRRSFASNSPKSPSLDAYTRFLSIGDVEPVYSGIEAGLDLESVDAETIEGLGLPGYDISGAPAGYRCVTRNIEDLRAGDLVLSTDVETGDTMLKPVVDAFSRPTRHLRHPDLKAAGGATQHIETTDEHPFYSLTAEYRVPAGGLEPGDEVVGPTGEIQHVAATRPDERPEGVTVYNFEVEDYHSSYVQARGARASPVLVHNATRDYSTAQNATADIAKGFQNLECIQCARAIEHRLEKAVHSGQVVDVRAESNHGYMIRVDTNEVAFESNFHRGVLIDGKGFCNQFPDGRNLDEWVKSFNAVGSVVLVPGAGF